MTANEEIIRKDSKERVLGDKAFVGDMEVVGKFTIIDRSNNTIYEFDPDAGTVTVYDQSGNIIWQTNIITGVMTGLAKESYIPLTSSGSNAGGNISFYTDSTTYVNLSDTTFLLDISKFTGASIYLEIVGRAGAFGDSLRKLSCQLYNMTDSSDVTSSLAESSLTSDVDGHMNRFRSGAITFPSGAKEYLLRYKSDTGGRYVDIQSARLIIQF
jgi:hypothetical protein